MNRVAFHSHGGILRQSIREVFQEFELGSGTTQHQCQELRQSAGWRRRAEPRNSLLQGVGPAKMEVCVANSGPHCDIESACTAK